MEGKLMQQLYKYCTVQIMGMPKREYLKKWFGKDFPDDLYATGDIRKFVQFFEHNDNTCVRNDNFNYIDDSQQTQRSQNQTMDLTSDIHIAIQAAWFTLKDKWNTNEELDLETKDANLAGLLYHQNIPNFFGTQKCDGDYYSAILNLIYISDRADFWAFFHQCWNLLPLSQDLKLKIPSLRLSQEVKLPVNHKMCKHEDLRYTPVLTKQSAIFNSWKFMCEIADTEGIPVHTVPAMCHLEAGKPDIKADRQRRLRNIALQTLLE